MKIRLVEVYDVVFDSTHYEIERKAWDGRWKRVMNYSNQETAKGMFQRFKKSGGVFASRRVLEQHDV